MEQFIKEFEIRWNDLDANRHVANATFSIFMNETRMALLAKNNFTQSDFEKLKVGPVILNETFYYLKEVKLNQKIYVDIELLGTSEDFKFWRLSHSLFLSSGELAVYSELLFSWFDLQSRKLISPPDRLYQIFSSLIKSSVYKTISQEETRNRNIPYTKTLSFDFQQK